MGCSRYRLVVRALLFDLMIGFFYRVGCYIPLPGIDVRLLVTPGSHDVNAVSGLMDLFSGGSMARVSIFSLGIIPFISATFLYRVLVNVSPRLRDLSRRGTSGELLGKFVVKLGAIVLGLVEGAGFCFYAFGLRGPSGALVVTLPWLLFVTVGCLVLLGGISVLIWFSELIDRYGLGSGPMVLIFFSIVTSLPQFVLSSFSGRSTEFVIGGVVVVLFCACGLGFLVVFFESSLRRVFLNSRSIRSSSSGRLSFRLDLKLSMTGVFPLFSAYFCFSLLLLFFQWMTSGEPGLFTNLFVWISESFRYGSFSYFVGYDIVLFVVVFLFSGFLVSPLSISNYLNHSGFYFDRIRPGVATFAEMGRIIAALSVINGFYLVVACSVFMLPFYLLTGVVATWSGMLIVLVMISLDILKRVRRLVGATGFFRFLVGAEIYDDRSVLDGRSRSDQAHFLLMSSGADIPPGFVAVRHCFPSDGLNGPLCLYRKGV